MNLKKKFKLVVLLLIFFPSLVLIIITNIFMKHLAYEEAYSKMEIMLARTNAIHQFINEDARPVIIEMINQYEIPSSFFKPEIMASSYAVREINNYFINNIDTAYYFKEISINPRNPANDANDFEKQILQQFNENRTITEYKSVETVDGKKVFRYIKRGEILEKACMQCHSIPALAPKNLLDVYGDERGFNKSIGDVVSAQSVMIPLDDAYATANRLSIVFGIITLCFMTAVGLGLSKFLNSQIFNRVDRVKIHFEKVTKGQLNINNEMIDSADDEIADLVNYYNGMAKAISQHETKLQQEKNSLKEKVDSQTASLKAKNEQMEHYANELKRSNEELREFTSVASHDLQEPLRKVVAFSERLRRGYAHVLDEKGIDYLERMEKATIRMQSLIDNLLKLSRINSSHEPFDTIDLQMVVEEVVGDLQERIDQTGGQVILGQLPTLKADKLQMRQLFQNLISNSLKYHKNGRSPIVSVNSSETDNETWEITVTDNGIGFNEEHTERIFKPFNRLHGRNEYEGSGMGLAICKKVVERHSGSITAKSTIGEGSTFIIKLPKA
ncbi:MAG: DUF3365 domain-containing protein [Bacillota bacterium]|nr:DUF3365 domain-containing protein [Bacillota bacterium]